MNSEDFFSKDNKSVRGFRINERTIGTKPQGEHISNDLKMSFSQGRNGNNEESNRLLTSEHNISKFNESNKSLSRNTKMGTTMDGLFRYKLP
jgi:hypothetical protein